LHVVIIIFVVGRSEKTAVHDEWVAKQGMPVTGWEVGS
jgi:hypothetical protein